MEKKRNRQTPVLGGSDIFHSIQLIVHGRFLTSCNLVLLLAIVPQRCSIQLIQLQDVRILTVWCVVMGLSTSYRAHLQIINTVSHTCYVLLEIVMEILIIILPSPTSTLPPFPFLYGSKNKRSLNSLSSHSFLLDFLLLHYSLFHVFCYVLLWVSYKF